MTIYCIEKFKIQIEFLESRKQYKEIKKDISDYFHGKQIAQLCSGTRPNNSDVTPYIKKRINGSGGYRLYFLVLIKDNNIYLMFVHPKTGPEGSENITDEAKAEFYKIVLSSIQSQELYEVDTNNQTLTFTKVPMQAPKKK